MAEFLGRAEPLVPGRRNQTRRICVAGTRATDAGDRRVCHSNSPSLPVPVGGKDVSLGSAASAASVNPGAD